MAGVEPADAYLVGEDTVVLDPAGVDLVSDGISAMAPEEPWVLPDTRRKFSSMSST